MKPDSTRNADERRREEGREVRARCWAYIFACYEARRTSEQSGNNDGKKDEDIRSEERLLQK